MGEESRAFFNDSKISLPHVLLNPFHQSSNNHRSIQEEVEAAYEHVSLSSRRELYQLYEIDFKFFEYAFDPETLKIWY